MNGAAAEPAAAFELALGLCHNEAERIHRNDRSTFSRPQVPTTQTSLIREDESEFLLTSDADDVGVT